VKYPVGFDPEKLKIDLSLNEDDIKIVDAFVSTAMMSRNPDIENFPRPDNNSNIFYSLHTSKDSNYIILTHEAFFNYQNYLNYLQSEKLSKAAITISILGILLSILLSFSSIWFSQKQITLSEKQIISPLEIKQSQIEEIKNSLKSIKAK
jgi:hypothetical protein